MKYERLTNRGEPFYGFEKCRTCEYGKGGCDKWCDQITGCFCRLQEIEDKIESGELCEREEVRKETAREILRMLIGHEMRDKIAHMSWVITKQDLLFVSEKYGIDLEDKQ